MLILERKPWTADNGGGPGGGMQSQQSSLLVSDCSTPAQRGETLATLPLEGVAVLQESSKPMSDLQTYSRTAGRSAETQATKRLSGKSHHAWAGGFRSGCSRCVFENFFSVVYLCVQWCYWKVRRLKHSSNQDTQTKTSGRECLGCILRE